MSKIDGSAQLYFLPNIQTPVYSGCVCVAQSWAKTHWVDQMVCMASLWFANSCLSAASANFMLQKSSENACVFTECDCCFLFSSLQNAFFSFLFSSCSPIVDEDDDENDDNDDVSCDFSYKSKLCTISPLYVCFVIKSPSLFVGFASKTLLIIQFVQNKIRFTRLCEVFCACLCLLSCCRFSSLPPPPHSINLCTPIHLFIVDTDILTHT